MPPQQPMQGDTYSESSSVYSHRKRGDAGMSDAAHKSVMGQGHVSQAKGVDDSQVSKIVESLEDKLKRIEEETAALYIERQNELKKYAQDMNDSVTTKSGDIVENKKRLIAMEEEYKRLTETHKVNKVVGGKTVTVDAEAEIDTAKRSSADAAKHSEISDRSLLYREYEQSITGTGGTKSQGLANDEFSMNAVQTADERRGKQTAAAAKIGANTAVTAPATVARPAAPPPTNEGFFDKRKRLSREKEERKEQERKAAEAARKKKDAEDAREAAKNALESKSATSRDVYTGAGYGSVTEARSSSAKAAEAKQAAAAKLSALEKRRDELRDKLIPVKREELKIGFMKLNAFGKTLEKNTALEEKGSEAEYENYSYKGFDAYKKKVKVLSAKFDQNALRMYSISKSGSSSGGTTRKKKLPVFAGALRKNQPGDTTANPNSYGAPPLGSGISSEHVKEVLKRAVSIDATVRGTAKFQVTPDNSASAVSIGESSIAKIETNAGANAQWITKIQAQKAGSADKTEIASTDAGYVSLDSDDSLKMNSRDVQGGRLEGKERAVRRRVLGAGYGTVVDGKFISEEADGHKLGLLNIVGRVQRSRAVEEAELAKQIQTSPFFEHINAENIEAYQTYAGDKMQKPKDIEVTLPGSTTPITVMPAAGPDRQKYIEMLKKKDDEAVCGAVLKYAAENPTDLPGLIELITGLVPKKGTACKIALVNMLSAKMGDPNEAGSLITALPSTYSPFKRAQGIWTDTTGSGASDKLDKLGQIIGVMAGFNKKQKGANFAEIANGVVVSGDGPGIGPEGMQEYMNLDVIVQCKEAADSVMQCKQAAELKKQMYAAQAAFDDAKKSGDYKRAKEMAELLKGKTESDGNKVEGIYEKHSDFEVTGKGVETSGQVFACFGVFTAAVNSVVNIIKEIKDIKEEKETRDDPEKAQSRMTRGEQIVQHCINILDPLVDLMMSIIDCVGSFTDFSVSSIVGGMTVNPLDMAVKSWKTLVSLWSLVQDGKKLHAVSSQLREFDTAAKTDITSVQGKLVHDNPQVRIAMNFGKRAMQKAVASDSVELAANAAGVAGAACPDPLASGIINISTQGLKFMANISIKLGHYIRERKAVMKTALGDKYQHTWNTNEVLREQAGIKNVDALVDATRVISAIDLHTLAQSVTDTTPPTGLDEKGKFAANAVTALTYKKIDPDNTNAAKQLRGIDFSEILEAMGGNAKKWRGQLRDAIDYKGHAQ